MPNVTEAGRETGQDFDQRMAMLRMTESMDESSGAVMSGAHIRLEGVSHIRCCASAVVMPHSVFRYVELDKDDFVCIPFGPSDVTNFIYDNDIKFSLLCRRLNKIGQERGTSWSRKEYCTMF